MDLRQNTAYDERREITSTLLCFNWCPSLGFTRQALLALLALTECLCILKIIHFSADFLASQSTYPATTIKLPTDALNYIECLVAMRCSLIWKTSLGHKPGGKWLAKSRWGLPTFLEGHSTSSCSDGVKHIVAWWPACNYCFSYLTFRWVLWDYLSVFAHHRGHISKRISSTWRPVWIRGDDSQANQFKDAQQICCDSLYLLFFSLIPWLTKFCN